MSDEFDDALEPGLGRRTPKHRRVSGPASPPRLVGRLYAAADGSLRAQLLACLLRPLGPLARAAIAAGVFAKFVATDSFDSVILAMDGAGRYSNEQIAELARFVEQVQPQALDQFAHLIADNRIGMAAFSMTAATMLLRALSKSRA